MRQETIRALEVRKNSVMAERRKSQMQTLGANNEYGVVTNVSSIEVKCFQTFNSIIKCVSCRFSKSIIIMVNHQCELIEYRMPFQ